MARLIQDIQYEGNNQYFVWKSPVEDFETGSVVTVHESQTALFYRNGECVGALGAGRHILETESVPFLNGILKKVTGGENIFHACIYFVNHIEMFALKWGVGNIVYEDVSGLVFTIGCNGEINLRVNAPRLLVEKLLGTAESLIKEDLISDFRGFIGSEITDLLIHTMVKNQISIFQISMHLKTLSEQIAPRMEAVFEKYGFQVTQFRILRVLLPEEDTQFARLKRLKADQSLMMRELELKQQAELLKQETEARKIKMEADALAFKRQAEGYTYQQERQFDVMQAGVENKGMGAAGSANNQFVDLGIGLSVAGAVSEMMKGNLKNVLPDTEKERPADTANGAGACAKCGFPLLVGAKFCPQCGERAVQTGSVVCPNCKKETPALKFCVECGYKLVPDVCKCAKCGFMAETPVKFCPQCGNPFGEEEEA